MLQKEIEYSIIPNQSLHTNHYKIRKNLNFEFPYFFSMPKTSCLNPKKTLKTAIVFTFVVLFFTHTTLCILLNIVKLEIQTCSSIARF